MALIRRVSRLFTADMHAVLDQIEEPEVVLRQAIREMEEELARQRQRGKWLRAEIESAAAKRDASEALRRDLDARLDIAFANDNEALARRLTRRKLETAKLAEQTEARRQALVRQLEELEALVEANADHLEGMQQKASLLAEDCTVGGGGDMRASGIDDDDVEIAFLREKQARASS
ncbi:MAG TPA: PspA/IM30 family protein [Gammaproteobacteria bacterium]|nr:PspA/IM30 family protein [Gammaproteobacteria bacterium]